MVPYQDNGRTPGWVGRGELCGREMWGKRKKWRDAYLSCGIDNLGSKFLVLIPNDLAEGIFNRGIVALDEVPVDELHRQTRLACGSLGQSVLLHTRRRRELDPWNSPTALLPTMAILRCFGAGILRLAVWAVREVRDAAERLASVEVRPEVDGEMLMPDGNACSCRFPGSS